MEPVLSLDLPVLSPGRHRLSRRRGCFLEVASFLAGERWSDRPACVHPVVAHFARVVNDLTSPGARPALAPLVPMSLGSASPDRERSLHLTVFLLEETIARVGSSRPLDTSLLVARRFLGLSAPVLESELHPDVRFAADLVPSFSGYVSRGCPASAEAAATLLFERSPLPERDGVMREVLHSLLLYSGTFSVPSPFPEDRWALISERLGTVPVAV